MSRFSPASSGLIKLRIEKDKVDISAQDIDFSTSAKESLACQYEGTNMSIGFKAGFLIDILNNIPSQEIVLQLADPSRAGVIVPSEQAEGENLLMLVPSYWHARLSLADVEKSISWAEMSTLSFSMRSLIRPLLAGENTDTRRNAVTSV